MRTLLIISLLALVFILGCSGGGNLPSSPDIGAPKENASTERSHYSWGLWQGVIDPEAQTLEFAQLRTGDFHLNALPFLEPPPLVNLTLESLKFNGNMIDADIGLRHPFLGLTEFTGFDVCGIFITNGSISGFSDTGIRMAGKGDTRLLNPDGYSRWWNPAEFPHGNNMSSYKDGLLGATDSYADYNSTLNAYKYFCDDLLPNDSPDKVTLAKRGIFSAGQKNIRHYTIELGTEGLIFNYAVDASWKFPSGQPPWHAPDDFPPDANRAEGWRIIATEAGNTLWNDGTDKGGDLILDIDVYDWFNAGMNTMRVESPGNFPMVESATVIGGGDGYSTYEVEIFGATPAAGQIELLISVISDEADFEGFITGINTTSYFTHTVAVSGESPAGYHWEFDDITTFAGVYSYDPTSTEFDDISPAIIDESDGDISLTWAGTDTNNVIVGIDSVFWLRRSTDNGVTYGLEQYGDSGSDVLLRADRNKICRGMKNDSYAVSGFNQDANGSGWVYVVWTVNPWGTANRGVFVSYPRRDIEVFSDTTGYIYCFDDDVGNIEMKHSTAPNTLDYWTWHDTTMYPTYTVGTSAYCSHVRSAGEDSSAVVWLAFYNNAETRIILSHSTGPSPHETWDYSTIVYSAGTTISQVKNPSLFIDSDDIFHICYTRFDSSTGKYQLIYTKDDSSFDNPTEEVIFESNEAINDGHISIGEKFGKQVIIFTYENNKSVYLITLIDGKSIGDPIEIDNNTDDIDPDGILDTDQCDFHSVWATMDGTNYDVARRNGVLIED